MRRVKPGTSIFSTIDFKVFINIKSEKYFRKKISNMFLAGFLTFLFTLLAVMVLPALLLILSRQISPLLCDFLSIYIIYSGIAMRSLWDHSRKVYLALQNKNNPLARKSVALIVGRDTECLNEKENIRACLESVSESLVDGITAPLFFAFLAGPLGIIFYKTIRIKNQ